MEMKSQTSGEYFKALQIIFYALVAGQVMFGFVALLLVQMAGFNAELQDLKQILLIVVCIFVMGGYLGSRVLFQVRMKSARAKGLLAEKLDDYRSTVIIRFALLEGPSMLAVIAYLITGLWTFLIITAFIIVIFFTLRPTPDKAINDLQLNLNEEQIILNPNSILTNNQ